MSRDEWPTQVRDPIEPPDGLILPERTDEFPAVEVSAEPPAARRFGRGLALGLAALIVLATAAAAGAWALKRGGGEPARPAAAAPIVPAAAPGRTTVPRVVGYKQTRALVVLGEAHLKAKLVRRATPKATGLVLSQKPAEGAEVDRDTKIVLVVDAGVPPVKVPDLVGKPFAEASKALRALGLKVRKTELASEREPGTVLQQTPAADAKAKKGSSVVLTVARIADVAVPSLVGLAVADAERMLADAGLRYREYAVPSSQPKGTVVAQRPAADVRVRKGSPLRLNVSKGPAAAAPAPPQPSAPAASVRVAVPDVTGQDEDGARSTLEDAGFSVTVEDQATADPAEDGIVTAQDPQGGKAPSGSTVTIVVARLG